MGFRLDIFAVAALGAGFLTVYADQRVEAQAVEQAKALVTPREGVEVELGRPNSLRSGSATIAFIRVSRSVLAVSSAFAASSALPLS